MSMTASNLIRQFSSPKPNLGFNSPKAKGGIARRCVSHMFEKNKLEIAPFRLLIVAAMFWTVLLPRASLARIVFVQHIRTLAGHEGLVNSVAFSPDGKTLASGSYDNTVKLWDVGSGKVIRTLTGHEDVYVYSVAFSPDGKTLASGSNDKTIKLWDVGSGKVIRTLAGHEDGVVSVAFSPDGKTLASGSMDKTANAKLWDVGSGELLRTLAGHEDWVNSVAFSPDGQTLASGSEDKTVKLWDVGSGELLRTLVGHEDGVISVAFSAAGPTLASGGKDKTIKLWDVGSGKVIRTLAGQERWVYSVAFSPDGQILASGSMDKTVKLWCAMYDPLEFFSSRLIQRKSYLEKWRDDAIEELNAPKGEFETTEQYRQRQDGTRDRTVEIQIQFGIKMVEDKEAVRKEVNEVLKSSTIVYAVKFGAYDADGGFFPFMAEVDHSAEMTGRLKVRTDLAPKIKQSGAILEEYFQITEDEKVVKQYRARANVGDGSENGTSLEVEIFGAGSTESVGSAAASAEYEPPKLSIRSVNLRDASGDGVVDASEEFDLEVDVANEGEAVAEGVQFQVSEVESKSALPPQWVGRVDASSAKSVLVHTAGADDLPDGEMRLEVKAVDEHGVGSNPRQVVLKIARRRQAALELTDLKLVSDGNANGRLEANEKGTLRFQVANVGEGTFRKGRMIVSSTPPLIFTAGSAKDILELKPNQTEELFVSVVVPAELGGKDIDLSVTATGENLKNGKFESLSRMPIASSGAVEPPIIVSSGRASEVSAPPARPTAELDVEKDIPPASAVHPTTLAIVIGNRNYKNLWPVEYARRDAEWMKEYIVKRLGVSPDNIIQANDLTLSDFINLFGDPSGDIVRSRLNRTLRDRNWNIIVYYSGHGMADADEKQNYLLPVDVNPDYLSGTGYRLAALYRNLRQVTDGRITVILESCFSGRTPKGQLGGKTSGVVIVDPRQGAPQDIEVLAAAHSDQVANWYEDQKHGLFTYYLMRALRGEADADKDGKVTGPEIRDFVTSEVAKQSYKIGTAYQEPEINVYPDEVWTQ